MPRGGLTFNGPFLGVATDIEPRKLSPGMASDCDNVVFTNGVVTQRPGLVETPGGGEIDSNDIRHVRYVGGIADYIIAMTKTDVWLQRWDEDLQPRAWLLAIRNPPFINPTGGMFVHQSSTYMAFGSENGVFRGRLDNIVVEDCGLGPIESPVTIAPVVSAGNADYLFGTVTLYVSRYNSVTGAESNACEVAAQDCTGGEKITLTISTTSARLCDGLTGCATHYRIYQSRPDGLGYPGLLVTIPVDETLQTSVVYAVGDVATEGNGGAVYAEADDDTNYNYAPPTMNGVPPAATCFAMHRSRMFYGTKDGMIYFSQSVDELQGGVECVAPDSYRRIPSGEPIVSMLSLAESLYIFTSRRIYRLSGNVNSLTNAQVAVGVLADEAPGTDTLDELEQTAGCVSHDSVIVVNADEGQLVLYAGPQSIYAFDGLRSIPITNNVQGRYMDNLSACGQGYVSAAFYKRIDLVCFCFRNNEIMGYDTAGKTWTLFSVFPIGGAGNAAFLGPVTSRRVGQIKEEEAILLRQYDAAFETSICMVFDESEIGDEVAFGNTVHTWYGPDLDFAAPGDRKNSMSFTAFMKKGTGGAVAAQCWINGDSTKDVPDTAVQFPQTTLDVCPVKVRLGFRALSVLPVVYLSETYRSTMLGYEIRPELVGRR